MKINKKESKLISCIILICLICIVGISYAYFTAGISSESNTTIKGDAGIMKISYSGGKNINLSGIYPRDEVWVTKTITVTGNNTTDAEMYYRLTLVVDSNTFKASDPLQYELVSTNTSANGEAIPSVSKTNITSSSINLGDGYFVKASNATHVYQLKIYYPRTDENQNDNQNASFNSHVEIKSVTKPKELGFDTIQRGAIKNKVFSTKEPGTLKFQFLCENKEQKSGGLIPMAFCLDYKLSISNYVINENSTSESDKYIIEMSEYYDYNWPDFNKPGGDTEIVDINITQGIIDNYKGKIPFDFDVIAPLNSEISLPQLGQAYWFRLYFIDSSDNLYLVDWLHMDKDGTPPSDDGTGGLMELKLKKRKNRH